MHAALKPPAKARPHGNTHVGLVVLRPMRAAGVPPEDGDDPQRAEFIEQLQARYHNRKGPEA